MTYKDKYVTCTCGLKWDLLVIRRNGGTYKCYCGNEVKNISLATKHQKVKH